METFASSKVQGWLAWFLRGVLIFGFLILFARVIELTTIKGDYYKALADENRVRRVTINAPRGRIFSREGELLVGNREIKRGIIFDEVEGYEKTEYIEGLSPDQLITEHKREYILGDLLGHASGYLGEAGGEEVGKVDPRCVEKGEIKLGSMIGRGGLEEYYDCRLRGLPGEELIEVGSTGEKIRTLGFKDPIPGENLKTNISYDLQQKIANIMKGKKGVVIATDSKSQVLAIYSSPSFDPNIFVKGEDTERISEILNDNDKPVFNRAISGVYQPGSIFKPVVAIAALEEEAIEDDYTYEDKGEIFIETIYGDFSYKNWYFTQYGGVEGKIGLEKAIARSTDTFFYKIGEKTGIENIKKWSESFGLNEKTGIDLPGEAEGLIPDPEWKEKVKGERWFLGNTYHVSIGQGDLLLTPIAINTAVASIASGGNYCQPSLVGQGECKEVKLDRKNLNQVVKGMVMACSVGGTGYTFFDVNSEKDINGEIDKIQKKSKVACKTGTAQTSDINDDTHAWFTFFAPKDDPEIVVTVLVEGGGEGSRVAGPIAREIYDYWYSKN